MMTLRKFALKPRAIPTAISWYLADLGRSQGKQELFARQAPHKLKLLREHAMIESAISSNRIEGVEVERERIQTLVFGKPVLRDRGEEEIRGYRDALGWIHEGGAAVPLNEKTILELHRLSRGNIWDAGCYKEKPVDIIEKHPDGRQTIRFRTLAPEKTPEAVREMIELWDKARLERWIRPLILIGALNLDFLCIHPFRDGNGRVSRLLLLLTCYHAGIEVGRFISLERLIEENKERYYETLRASSHGWHEAKHDHWPYIGYLLFIIKKAYEEFELRANEISAPRGEKSELVRRVILKQRGEFRLADIERACPGVGRDWIRAILFEMKKKGLVICKGKGKAARWQRIGE